MSDFGVLWFGVMFALVALMFLLECVEHLVAAGRRRLSRGPGRYRPTYAAGFSLRRPDSVLRERHRRKVRPEGRLTEINRYKDDPYEP
jgi:hypothetical protein